MNAIILAAGFGTRLKPWTDHNPKALVPVEGKPMLERIIRKLESAGVRDICINVHHFGEKIIDFIKENTFQSNIIISDEREEILDTGGGVLKALKMFRDNSPVLVHNVDILSDLNINDLFSHHERGKNDVTLVVSPRESSRELIFDSENNLKGWHDKNKNIFIPSDINMNEESYAYAFSGIYMINQSIAEDIENVMNSEKFPIMDYFLNRERKTNIKGLVKNDLILLDIGKPASLAQASNILNAMSNSCCRG